MRTRVAALAALTAALFVAVPAHAQLSFGGVAALHDDFDLGLGVQAVFPTETIHEQLRAQGEFLWFFPGEGVDYFEINGNLLYDFDLEDQSFTPFLLGGVNIARVSIESESPGFDGTSTEVGLNLGGGLTFETEGSLRPSVGARIEVSGGEGLVIFGSFLVGGAR